MAELRPIETEIEWPKPSFRPIHLLASFAWLNFVALIWVGLFSLLPESTPGAVVISASLLFFLLAMGSSAVGYDRGVK
jgi:hypothetical protein